VKTLTAPVVAAAAMGLLVYGALAAAERKLPPPADPWLDGFLEAGLKAEFRAETTDPAKSLLWLDGRELFDVSALREAPVRHYLVGQAGVQVIRLPDAGALADEIPEGRNLEHKLKPKGGAVHACRKGRLLLLVSVQQRGVFLLGSPRTPKKAVEAMFDVFEDVAR
jgi:hypothetical protein